MIEAVGAGSLEGDCEDVRLRDERLALDRLRLAAARLFSMSRISPAGLAHSLSSSAARLTFQLRIISERWSAAAMRKAAGNSSQQPLARRHDTRGRSRPRPYGRWSRLRFASAVGWIADVEGNPLRDGTASRRWTQTTDPRGDNETA